MRSGWDQAGPRVATILVRRMEEPGTKASTKGVGDTNGSAGKRGSGEASARGTTASYPHPSPAPSLRLRGREGRGLTRGSSILIWGGCEYFISTSQQGIRDGSGWLNAGYQHGCGMGKVSPRFGVESVESATLLLAGQSTRGRLNFQL